MILAMTLLVRDEEDIIAANLDYHLARGVDFVIVTDNASVDATGEILGAYEAQGVVHTIHEPADDYSQSKWVTRMARLAAEEGADWVINNDADEFWWPRSAANLKGALAEVRDDVGVLYVPRRNFPPRPVDGRPFYERMTIRDLDSRNARGRPLPPKAAHRAGPDVSVDMGNHGVSGPGLDRGEECREIEILHFPMRAYEQFENKIIKGGRALAANRELPRGAGATWRELYALWRRGELREFYDREVRGPAETPESYVEDTRLRDWMREARTAASGSLSRPG